jgi:transcriptional regulator with XRE-family HTH domain
VSRRVRRGRFTRSCRRCSWTGTYDTTARANYAKRRHSCEKQQRTDARLERGRTIRAGVDRTPKPCLHPIANHQHGTYACYTLDFCRCEACGRAVSDYERERKRQQAYGRWDNLVDAEPARRHVRWLMSQGMGLKRIAATGAISQGSLWKLLYGKNGGPVSKRLTKSVAERVLAVELDLADGAVIDGADTARRLQALVANGWSMSKLALRLGWSPGNLNPSIKGDRGVTVALAKAVHALYVELADQQPPTESHHDKVAASRARGYAAARGWLPPLRINGRLVVGRPLPSPQDLEEPAAFTDFGGYDEAAVTRRLDGDRGVSINKADRIEVVRRARAWGWTFLDIERRAGIPKPERYITRAQQEAS